MTSKKSVVVIDGGGKDQAPLIAEHLRDLGHEVWMLLASDKSPNEIYLKRANDAGVLIHLWPDKCSAEERLFLDLPWSAVRETITLASQLISTDSVMAVMDTALKLARLPTVTEQKLTAERDTIEVRRILGKVANKSSWFKGIDWLRLLALASTALKTNLLQLA
jgi:putative ATP-dependent endonuclease of the OLD family